MILAFSHGITIWIYVVVIKAMFGFWNMVLYIVVFKSLVLLISCQKVGQVVYRFHLNILWSSSFSSERHMTTRYIEILNDIIVIVGLLNLPNWNVKTSIHIGLQLWIKCSRTWEWAEIRLNWRMTFQHSIFKNFVFRW